MTAATHIAHARHLGRLLRNLRLQAGLTQTELGRRTYLTKGGVSKRELESRALSLGAFIETADALGYDVLLVPRAVKAGELTRDRRPA